MIMISQLYNNIFSNSCIIYNNTNINNNDNNDHTALFRGQPLSPEGVPR